MSVTLYTFNLEVKRMQRPGTEATRTQIQPSKLNREITKIINSQNTKRTYGQPSEQLFPKRWSLSNPNRTQYEHTQAEMSTKLRHQTQATANHNRATVHWNGQ